MTLTTNVDPEQPRLTPVATEQPLLIKLEQPRLTPVDPKQPLFIPDDPEQPPLTPAYLT